MTINEYSHSIADEVIAFRRDIHQHPEIGMQEFRTTDRICEELDKIGVSYRRTEPTGVIAEIKGTNGESNHIVAIRGDIDCLNISEKTGLPFASVNEGMMHACGHDTHAAMMLGAAKAINEFKDQFAGTVRFLFQPSEENGQGAKKLIEQNCMDGVDFVYGVHISSALQLGKIGFSVGPTHAAANRWWIKVWGKTSHGADPANGIDATMCAVQIAENLQHMVSRENDPSQALVVTVGQFHSGTRYNIISGYAEMEGTTRCYSREVYAKIPEQMERIAQGIARAHRCKAEVIIEQVSEVLYNDEEAYAIGCEAIEKVAPGSRVEVVPTMGGEDFAFYTKDTKGAFFSLGGRVADDSKVYPMHHECVDFDEAAFEKGVALYTQVAIDTLNKING